APPVDCTSSVARRLARGTYRLQVDPVGEKRARTSVAMEMPEETTEKALAVPAGRIVSPGATVHVFPLEIPPGSGFLAVSASSVENIGLALEVEEQGAWRVIGSRVGRSVRLETPLSPA